MIEQFKRLEIVEEKNVVGRGVEIDFWYSKAVKEVEGMVGDWMLGQLKASVGRGGRI